MMKVMITILLLKITMMRFTLEWNPQVDRIQAEIKQLQRNSEESATVSDKLNREVRKMTQRRRRTVIYASSTSDQTTQQGDPPIFLLFTGAGRGGCHPATQVRGEKFSIKMSLCSL